MNPRAKRIVAAAVDLAEKGGFEAVRLRDVAAEAEVALGTLYRYFRSKEDLLIAALASEMEQLESRMQGRVPTEGDASARVSAFFTVATKGFTRRPRLARAILKAAASGDNELAEKVAAFHSSVSALIRAALAGKNNGADDAETHDIVLVLEYVWFAALVGWAGGLHEQSEVIERMHSATALVLSGSGSNYD